MEHGAREGLVLDQLYRSLVEGNSDGVVTVDPEGGIVTVNRSAERIVGAPPGGLAGRRVLELIHPDDLARAAADLTAGVERGAPVGTSCFRVAHCTDGWVHVDVTASDVEGAEPPLMALHLRPANDRRAIDHIVLQLLAGGRRRDVLTPICDLFAWRANRTRIGVCWWEPTHGFQQVSTDLPDALVGADGDATGPWAQARETLDEVVVGAGLGLDPDRQALADPLGVGPCWIVPVLDVGRRPPALLTVWGGPTGPPTQVHAYAMGEARALVALILRWSDQLERLDAAAHQDELTGLANRKAFLDRLEQVDGEGALLYCDLDGFKQVNDRLGHLAGDELLRQVGARLQHAVRSQDLVARIGGDEFAVLCEGAGPAVAAEVADRVHRSFGQPFRIMGASVQLAISVGIGHAPDHLDGATLATADRALYEAKAARRT